MIGKKGGVPIAIALIVLLTISLSIFTLYSFALKTQDLERNLYDVVILENLYSNVEIVNFQIQNLVDVSSQNIETKDEFVSNFNRNLITLGEDNLMPLQNQANNAVLTFENGEKEIAVAFNIKLTEEFVSQGEKVFQAEYSYDKEFTSKV